jgi:hypothetical protein
MGRGSIARRADDRAYSAPGAPPAPSAPEPPSAPPAPPSLKQDAFHSQAHANVPVDRLPITVTTGGDDLRGGG